MFAGLARAVQKLAAPPVRAKVRSGEVASGFSTSGGVPDLDYLDELQFPEYLEEFKRVANDAEVAKVIRETTQPIINADWCVEPASEDPRDILIAEFIAASRYQQEGETYGVEFWAETPWEDRLRDALRFLVNGFSVFQHIYRSQGRYTVLHKMKYLLPTSITRFKPGPEPDTFEGIIRNYIGWDGEAATEELVKMDDLTFYTWDQEGSNILGKSLMRSWWMAYQFKIRLMKMMMIDKQRTSIGIPYYKHPVGDTVENIARGEKVTKAMRAGALERLYVGGMTEGQDFGWKEGGQSTKGFPELIGLMDDQIRGGGGMGFTSLGQGDGQGGSRGVAGTQASFSTLLLEGIAKTIIRYERPGIRRDVDMNWPGTKRYPTLKCKGIDPFEKTRVQGEIVAAITGKAITNTIDTENELRRGWNLMEIDESERAKAQATEPSSTDGSGKAADPNADPNTPAGDDTATGGEDVPEPVTNVHRRLRLMDGQDDVVVRARVDAEAIRHELEKLESLYLATLSSVQDDMRDAVVEQIRSGALRPTEAKQVKVPFQQELKERLVAICKTVRDFGRTQVMAEVNRQLRALQRTAMPDPSTRRGAIAYSNQQAEVVAGLDVSGLVQRLQAQVTAQWNQLAGTGADPAEIAGKIHTYLGDLSSAQIEGMARSSTATVFNAGRNVAILELRPQLQPEAIRVEVLDENTCKPCGTPASEGGLNMLRVKIGSPDYLQNQPPHGCEGGVRCRGFYVVNARV